MESLIKCFYLETERLQSLRIEQREDTVEFYEALNEWPFLVLTLEEFKKIIQALVPDSLSSEELKNHEERLP